MTGTRTAVLFDFGGVLTTSVLAALAAFGRSIGAETLPQRLLREDKPSADLLVAHEEGRIGQRAFEDGFAARLRAHGAEVAPDGLVARMQAGLRPDQAMIALVRRLRARGWPTGMLSNSLGDDCYAGFDLPSLFDTVTLSRDIAVRKPSRLAYRIACERLGVAPEQAVMVDDLEQNVAAARRVGMAGVIHHDAAATSAALAGLLGSGNHRT